MGMNKDMDDARRCSCGKLPEDHCDCIMYSIYNLEDKIKELDRQIESILDRLCGL